MFESLIKKNSAKRYARPLNSKNKLLFPSLLHCTPLYKYSVCKNKVLLCYNKFNALQNIPQQERFLLLFSLLFDFVYVARDFLRESLKGCL